MSLDSNILANESLIRMTAFIVFFGLFAFLEILFPHRPLHFSKSQRWLNNVTLIIFNSFLLRFVLPLTAIQMAFWTQENSWGLFQQIELPIFIEIILAVLLLDLMIYWQHRMMHVAPLFWRLHQVHHADMDFDVTTAARFHSVEIVFSMLLKLLAIYLLGAHALAVLVFELMLSTMAMFNHSNLALPLKLDAILRKIIVTPDMHRVHHSVYKHETNSNYGFAIPWWDYLFNSYCAQPKNGHQQMKIGLLQWQNREDSIKLKGLLMMPFKGSQQSDSM